MIGRAASSCSSRHGVAYLLWLTASHSQTHTHTKDTDSHRWILKLSIVWGGKAENISTFRVIGPIESICFSFPVNTLYCTCTTEQLRASPLPHFASLCSLPLKFEWMSLYYIFLLSFMVLLYVNELKMSRTNLELKQCTHKLSLAQFKKELKRTNDWN